MKDEAERRREELTQFRCTVGDYNVVAYPIILPDGEIEWHSAVSTVQCGMTILHCCHLKSRREALKALRFGLGQVVSSLQDVLRSVDPEGGN